MSDNLFSRFCAGFSNPSRTFLERADGSVLSYSDLVDRSGQLANLFVERGVRPGDRIAVQVDKCPENLLVYLAALRAGAVYLPLNPAYTPSELRHFLSDAAPSLFICRTNDRDAMQVLAREMGVAQVETLGADGSGSLMDAAAAPAAFKDVARSKSDLAAILYTSGTTGLSKGAMLTHGNLASNAETLRDLWRFTADDRLLHALPIFHTHGLFVATNVTLMAGSSMIFLPAFDPRELIRLLPRASVLMGVPTFYSRLLAQPELTAELVAHMRLFVSGSAPLSAETHREFQARTGHRILERYGMTETNMNCSNPYEGERVPGSVGPALPGVEIRITNPETGRPTPGKTGAIEIRGPNVFAGYWRMPEKTASEFREDGFFISGDLGYVDEHDYLYIVGRAKDLIISGGFNVYPAEVEAVIDTLPGVSESAVIGVPHPDLGEAVIAVVAPKPGALLVQTDIAHALALQLARYKQPRCIFVIPELPRNAMGKIQKKDLRDDYARTFATETAGLGVAGTRSPAP